MRAYLIVQAGAEPGGDAADAVLIDACAAPTSGRGGAEAIRGGDAPARDRFAAPARTRERPGRLLLRVDDLEAPGLDACLGEIAGLRPDAVVLPARHGRDVAHLGARLAVAEAERGLPDGGIGIVALVACAAGVLAAPGFAGASPRLRGLGWDAVALARQLGMTTDQADAVLCPPLVQARAAIRLAAAAAGVEAIEAAYSGQDAAGFAAHVASARRDGFGAMFARDPAQARLIRGET